MPALIATGDTAWMFGDHLSVAMSMQPCPLPSPGWYADPNGGENLRWWDGVGWSPYVAPRPRRNPRWLRDQLPWRAWLWWLVPLTLINFVCFAQMESKQTHDPAVWFWAAVVTTAALIVGCSAATSRRGRWRDVAIFAAVVAAIVALALFTTSAPSTSRSCDNAGQPTSSGTYDCDTSYGLGGPILFVAFFVPSFVLAGAGKGLGRLVERSRTKIN